MHSLLPVVLSCLLLAFSAGVKADVYSDVNRLVVSEQWAKAQTQAEQHLKSQPTDPQMRLLLSRIQDGLGQTAAAMETLQQWQWQATAANPGHLPVKSQTRFEFCIEHNGQPCDTSGLAQLCQGEDMVRSTGQVYTQV